MTEQLWATDAYLRETDATVVDLRPGDDGVLLDRTVLRPDGGGQPADHGAVVGPRREHPVAAVSREGRDSVWHTLEEGTPSLGDPVRVTLDWDRRYLLMRTHTALHGLCGLLRERYGAAEVGSGMSPGDAWADVRLPGWEDDEREALEDDLNTRLGGDLDVEIDFLAREDAVAEAGLLPGGGGRLPAWLRIVRVVEIVGLDRRVDGGTHVASTGEVGRVVVPRVEASSQELRRVEISLVRDERMRVEGSGAGSAEESRDDAERGSRPDSAAA